MARYIDADAWEEFYKERTQDLESYNHYDMGYGDAMDHVDDWLDAHPTIEARPVVRGKWLGAHDGWYYSYSCSECGAEALTKEETMHDQVCSAFCPNCGADMRTTTNE